MSPKVINDPSPPFHVFNVPLASNPSGTRNNNRPLYTTLAA